MKCPVCGDKVENNRCEKCGKSIVDVCFKLAEKYQAQRDYGSAQKVMEELRKNVSDASVLNDIERIIKGIEFTRADSRDKDYIEESKEKKKGINGVFMTIFIIIGICIGLSVAYYTSEGKAFQKVTALFEKKEEVKITTPEAIVIKNIFLADVEEQFVNYKEGIFEKDIDGNGTTELIFVHKNNFYAFIPELGGRLIYWCDLKNKIEFVGGGIHKNNSATFAAIFTEENITLTENFQNKEGNIMDLSGVAYTYRQETPESITFEFEQYKKKVLFNENGFEVEYTYPKENTALSVFSFVEPDYFSALINKSKVSIEESDNKVSIVNPNSNFEMEIEYSTGCVTKRYEDYESGKSIELIFDNQNPKLTYRKIERLE